MRMLEARAFEIGPVEDRGVGRRAGERRAAQGRPAEARLADVGALVYWFLPVRRLMKDQFRSDMRIGSVTAPLLVLHGARDGVVPIGLGERLFSLANEPKQFVRFADGAHHDLDRHGAIDAVRQFIAQIAP